MLRLLVAAIFASICIAGLPAAGSCCATMAACSAAPAPECIRLDSLEWLSDASGFVKLTTVSSAADISTIEGFCSGFGGGFRLPTAFELRTLKTYSALKYAYLKHIDGTIWVTATDNENIPLKNIAITAFSTGVVRELVLPAPVKGAPFNAYKTCVRNADGSPLQPDVEPPAVAAATTAEPSARDGFLLRRAAKYGLIPEMTFLLVTNKPPADVNAKDKKAS